jgi:hypothetical protein
MFAKAGTQANRPLLSPWVPACRIDTELRQRYRGCPSNTARRAGDQGATALKAQRGRQLRAVLAHFRISSCVNGLLHILVYR